MVSRGVVGVFLTACLVFASGRSALGGAPEAVSPGELDRLVRVRDSCPTFSWGGVLGAESLELVVYELGGATEGEGDAEGGLRRVVHRSLPGSARGWTPSLAECLSYGGRYAWTVRAVGEGVDGGWSEARLFEVASLRPGGLRGADLRDGAGSGSLV